MKIRQISTDEWPQLSGPIQAYAFRPSPVPVNTAQSPRDKQRYAEEHITLVAELDGAAVADLSAVRMRQNVRGAVYPMAGLAGLATLPQVRRRGFARALITQMLGLMRESGHVVSALYPFRPSFYERFGYVGLPQARTVTSRRPARPGCWARTWPGRSGGAGSRTATGPTSTSSASSSPGVTASPCSPNRRWPSGGTRATGGSPRPG